MSCLGEIGFRSRGKSPFAVRLVGRLGAFLRPVLFVRPVLVDGIRIFAETPEEVAATADALEAVRARLPREFARMRRNADRVVLLGDLGQLSPFERELLIHEGRRSAGRIVLELAHANVRLWLFDTGRFARSSAQQRRLYAALGERALFRCFNGLQGHPVLEGVTREDAKALAGQLARALS